MTTFQPQRQELPHSRRDWMALLDRLGIRPSKGRGQNFLFERGVVSRMVTAAGVDGHDVVVEVGPGLGILTEELLHHAAFVIAIEVDNRLAAHLRDTFGAHRAFHIVEADALQYSPEALIAPDRAYQVVANLPYSVAAAVIRHFLEQAHAPARMTVMVQQEVAERIVANPPDMSILSVAIQFFATPRIAFAVTPSVFIPPPKVQSAVVILETLPSPRLPRSQHARFFRLVNAGFRHRRKQLANSIASELGQPKDEVSRWLSKVDVDPSRRAETLSVDDWIALATSAPREWLG